ncbi:MAG: flagellar hook-length control protein FliK [Ferrovibrio sp.]|uniref:flagellar hook-length control protein FliK n=1 Tax=Ferrovibrio sp. TaxID=1917215 RepID=UPI00391B0F1E
MQVAPVNNSAASASGSAAVEETDSRAREFSRLLQTAFFTQGAKAVTRGSEPAAPEGAVRSEVRPDTRNDDRGETRVQIRSERAPSESRPASPAVSSSSSSSSASPPSSDPSPKPASDRPVPACDDGATAKDGKPVADNEGKPAASDAGQQPGDAETKQAVEQAAGGDETADGEIPGIEEGADQVQPALVADAALILGLLQMQAQPQVQPQTQVQQPPAAVVVPVADAAAEAQLHAQLLAASAAEASVANPLAADDAVPPPPALPAAANAAADPAPLPQAAPTLPQMAKPAETSLLPQAAALPAELMAMSKNGTETSAAALMAQQPATVTAEQLAALQQALQAEGEMPVAPQDQTRSQIQDGVQPSAAKVPKSTERSLLLDIQPAMVSASKPAVDQAVILAAQGDAAAAAEQATLQQQLTTAQHHQSVADAKLVANLHAQMTAEIPAQAATATAASGTGSAAQHTLHSAPVSNPGASLPQAVQHAATHTLARQLGAYIPAGEQVAVQIKKGAAEGLDKISIKLDPGNLGKVEVKLEVGHDGKLMAVIAADKPETLAMLQREAQQLEQSLRDAGLKTDANSLSFSLREQGQNAEGRDGRDGGDRQRGRGHMEYAETGHVVDAAAVAASNAQRAAAARGGLDIRI